MKIIIMWIDDDARYLAAMKSAFEKAAAQSGMDVTIITESDPKLALTKVGDEKFWAGGTPQVFFLDFALPYLDGADLANAIAAAPWIRNPIIIYVTALGKAFASEEEWRKRGGKLDGYDVILKGSRSIRQMFDDAVERARIREKALTAS